MASIWFTCRIAGRDPQYRPITSSVEHIKAGKLRALVVTTSMRSRALPDVPTMGEFVSGYEASALFGTGVPANTPAEIIRTLNREINAGLAR